MASEVSGWLISFLARLFPALEPLLPSYVSFALRRRLRRWKKDGLILGYKTKTKRMGKLHYRVSVDLDVTPAQAKVVFKEATDRVARLFPWNVEEVIEWLKRRRVM